METRVFSIFTFPSPHICRSSRVTSPHFHPPSLCHSRSSQLPILPPYAHVIILTNKLDIDTMHFTLLTLLLLAVLAIPPTALAAPSNIPFEPLVNNPVGKPPGPAGPRSGGTGTNSGGGTKGGTK
jgi:hypothetical protein